MKKTFGSLAVFVTFFAFGYGYLVLMSDSFQMLRDPAAIRDNHDFSNLREDALKIAMKERLIRDFNYGIHDENLEISLSHFYISNSEGAKTSLCNTYPRVQMRFEVHGVVVNGDAPTMEIEGPCMTSTQSPNRLQAFLVPLTSLPETSQDVDLELNNAVHSEQPLRISFKNMEPNLPNQWILVSLALKNKDGGTLNLKANEVRRHDPVLLEW